MREPLSLRAILYRRIQIEVIIYALVLSCLVATILVISLIQLENQQAEAWARAIPGSVISHVKQGDTDTVQSKLELLKSTQLFTQLKIVSPQGHTIAMVKSSPVLFDSTKRIDIRDSQGVLWGYFEYQHNFWKLGGVVLMAMLTLAIGLALVFFFLRRRLERGIRNELAPFHRFLSEIKYLSDKISRDPAILKERFEFMQYEKLSEEEQAMTNVILKFLETLGERDTQLVQYTKEIARQKFLDEIARSAAMVSHDIRSPLAALQMVQRNTVELPENTRILIRDAVARIQDIANSLDMQRGTSLELKKVQPSTGIRPELLNVLISSLLSEKRLQLRNYPDLYIGERLAKESFGAFCNIDPAEFQRILSNLIDNSVDALQGRGSVRVYISNSETNWKVTVSDNGPGISTDLVKRLGQYGATFGKTKGRGLGLYHAKLNIESWEGRLEITSAPQKGTQVSLVLPKVRPPSWFASEIYMEPGTDIVILDDDPTIHDVWENIITQNQRERFKLRLFHFTRYQELGDWLAPENKVTNTLYLFDQEMPLLAEGGISLLEKIDHKYERFLVTSHVQDLELRKRCVASKVKLLPKQLAIYIPILFGPTRANILDEIEYATA